MNDLKARLAQIANTNRRANFYADMSSMVLSTGHTPVQVNPSPIDSSNDLEQLIKADVARKDRPQETPQMQQPVNQTGTPYF